MAETREQTREKFEIDEVFRRLRIAVADFPEAAMIGLRNEGYGSPFEQLIGALLSTRTRDEATYEVSLRLFSTARTPEEISRLSEAKLSSLIEGVGFPKVKARDLKELSERIIAEHKGQIPDTMEELIKFRGIGPKIAALVLSNGFGIPAIAVDVHVHRIVNRWGYVQTRTAEQTAIALEAVLPERYWIEINERLVSFGKFHCKASWPKCSSCLLRTLCSRVGVTKSH